MRKLLIVTLLLLAPLTLPSAPADPVEPEVVTRIVHVGDVPDADPLSLVWWAAFEAPAHLQGRPEGPWPRPYGPVALPPLAGELFQPSFLVLNRGTEAFEGSLVVRAPEIGVAYRHRTFDMPGPGAAFTITILHAYIPVPEDAPDRFTVELFFEMDGARVGESFTRTYEVGTGAWCPEDASLVHTAGTKRVRATWDAPYYALTACNASDEARTMRVTMADAETGRPFVRADTWLAWDWVVGPALDLVRDGRTPDAPDPRDAVLTVTLRPGSLWGIWYVPDEVGPVEDDLVPRITADWDDGRRQEVIGDALTFGGVDLPRAPPLPPT